MYSHIKENRQETTLFCNPFPTPSQLSKKESSITMFSDARALIGQRSRMIRESMLQSAQNSLESIEAASRTTSVQRVSMS
jgi:hypothetical protein